MKTAASRDRFKSYISAVLALVMVIFGLLRLPRVGYATIGGIFTMVWLGFALLIVGSHLRILLRDETVPSRSSAMAEVEQRRPLHRRVTQS